MTPGVILWVQAVVEHAGLLHFAGCSMHNADDGMAVQTEGALGRLQERLEEREPGSLLRTDTMHCGLNLLVIACYPLRWVWAG